VGAIIIGYARVSAEEQDLTAQRNAIEALTPRPRGPLTHKPAADSVASTA
jgi:hypothetical protein